jgi:hypothetical protein
VFVCLFLLSLQSNGSVRCIPQFDTMQRLGKHVPATTNTCNNIRIFGPVYLWVCVSPYCCKVKNSVKTFPQQRNCWRRLFLYGPCRIKRKYAIISSKNFFFSHLRLSLIGISSEIHKLPVNPTDRIKFAWIFFGVGLCLSVI